MNWYKIRVKVGFEFMKLAIRIIPEKELVDYFKAIDKNELERISPTIDIEDLQNLRQDEYAATKAASGVNVN